ncbi:MAG: DUF4349 domain-containing protein [Pseudomonadota bacterium]
MRLFPVSLVVLLLLVACGQTSEVPAPARAAMPLADMAQSKVGSGAQGLAETGEPAHDAPRRYIAMRHQLLVELPADRMQAAFDATAQQCEQLHCQMLSADFNKATQYAPPSASLSLRVPPGSLQVFLEGLGKNGEVLQHHRQSEDKTDQVIDADARIKNMTELRDRLRSMLASGKGSLKDIVEVERELANTQAQLDSIAGVRKALAQETDLVAVTIDFQATASLRETGFFAPVARAWDESGQVMMASVAAIISFLAAVLPWLAIVLPLFIGVRRLWRKFRARRA